MKIEPIQAHSETPAPRIAGMKWWARLVRCPSAGQIITQNHGIGPGFESMRIILAMTILVFHAKQVVQGRVVADYSRMAVYPVFVALVPLFFCLSGFLVTGSALRTKSIGVFLSNRSLRIFPALAVEVTLSALVLGPVLTDLPLSTYFSSIKFWSYFGNIIGRVRMSLPGVFLDHPIPDTVNASLWTLQPEFYCYLLMTALMLSTLAFKRTALTWVFLVASAVLSIMNWTSGFGNPNDVLPGHAVVYYFVAGAVAYHWRDAIPMHAGLFALSLGLVFVLLTSRGMVYVAAAPLTYCMIYCGMLRLPLIAPLKGGDYSYGIYLFNFPIQQSIVHFFPAVTAWWHLLFISVPLTVLFAAASWHGIEKPALSLKRHLRKRTANAAPVPTVTSPS